MQFILYTRTSQNSDYVWCDNNNLIAITHKFIGIFNGIDAYTSEVSAIYNCMELYCHVHSQV